MQLFVAPRVPFFLKLNVTPVYRPVYCTPLLSFSGNVTVVFPPQVLGKPYLVVSRRLSTSAQFLFPGVKELRRGRRPRFLLKVLRDELK